VSDEARRAYWAEWAAGKAVRAWRGAPVVQVALWPPPPQLPLSDDELADLADTRVGVATVRVENQRGLLVATRVDLPEELPPVPEAAT
jgi:hypothetical protein